MHRHGGYDFENSDHCPYCYGDELADLLKNSEERRSKAEDRLETLKLRVLEYMHLHDVHGDGSEQAGRAWFVLRQMCKK